MENISRKELIKALDDWWEEEKNLKGGILLALVFKGKKRKAEEIVTKFEQRKQAYQQIRKLISEKPKVTREWLNKQAEYLINIFHKECNLSELQYIGILTVLTEKGDLQKLFAEAGVEVEKSEP